MSDIPSPTHLRGQSVERCDTPSPSAPPSGRRRGSLRAPPSGPSLRFLAATSGIPPGPGAPPLHTTEAAERRGELGHMAPNIMVLCEEHVGRSQEPGNHKSYQDTKTELSDEV